MMESDDKLVPPEELRQIANALRQWASPSPDDRIRRGHAWKCLQAASDAGAFSSSSWTMFRIDSKRWSGGHEFTTATGWLKEHCTEVGVEVNQSCGNDDLVYWCPVFADIIEREADAIESRVTPRNYWIGFTNWWQRSWLLTILVVIITVLVTVRGLIGWIADFASWFGSSSP